MFKKLTVWCCISKGEASIKCYCNKSVYNIGENATVCAELDSSKAECDMNSLDIQFY